MSVAHFILFLTVQLAFAVSENSIDANKDQQVLTSIIYDDAEHKDIQQNFDQLRLMIKLQNKNLKEQFKLLRSQLKKYLAELKSSMNDSFKNKTQTTKSLPKDCTEAIEMYGQSGIYDIKIPDSKLEPFSVDCRRSRSLEDSNRAPWTLIQQRQDGSIDFSRTWTEYQRGFGYLEGEFFIGMDKIHALTQSTRHELWIDMGDFEGAHRWAKYSNFSIGDSSVNYTLTTLGNYTGDAGDSLRRHVGQQWSTKDRNNEVIDGEPLCGNIRSGAWWHVDCSLSNLNGKYLEGKTSTDDGIYWSPEWHTVFYSLKYVRMFIRPVQ